MKYLKYDNLKAEITKRLIDSLREDYCFDLQQSKLILKKLRPFIENHKHHIFIDRFLDLSALNFKNKFFDKIEQPLPKDDAIAKAPKNHEILCENKKVRVLGGILLAGEQEPLHRHYWPSILVTHLTQHALTN